MPGTHACNLDDSSYMCLVIALSITLGVTSGGVVTESARHAHVLGGQVRRFYIKAKVKP